MRPSRIAVGGGLLFLLLLGLRPDSLPFIPNAPFSDAAISHWPAALHLHEAGPFPLWQETILGGQPFAANPLNKVAYPPQWLGLLLPPALHLNLMILLHLLLAGWGMRRWLRLTGLREEAALFGALAYALGPKLLATTGAGHLDLLYALAWWPWLMAAVYRLARTGEGVIETALIASLLILGDLRLSLFALSLAAAYGLWQADWRRVLRPAVFTGGLVLLLTLSISVPLLIWAPWLSRSGMTASDAAVFSMEPGHLLGLLLPPQQGSPETLAYLGLPVLLLAGIALVAEMRKQIFWLFATLIGLLYGLGINGPLWPLLVSVLPPLTWFRVPARAWLLVLMAACVLASRGLEILMDAAAQPVEAIRRLVVKRLTAAAGIGAALFCGGFTLLALPDLPATVGPGVMLVGGLLGLTLLLLLYGRLNARQVALALTLVLALDLAWTGHAWLEWRGPDRWLTQQQALVDALEDEGPARIYSPNYALEQQVAAANDLHLLYGIDPFQLRGIVEAIAQGSGVPVEAYSVVLPPLDLQEDGDLQTANQNAVPDTQVLAAWGVSHVVTTYPMDLDSLQLRQQVGEDYIYANLDYTGQAAEGWPEQWPNLPDPAQVTQMNQMTLAALSVSAAAFLLCLGWRMRR